MANPKHIARPATPAAKPLTEEEKAAQVARFFSQKRETYFQLALANILQNPHLDAEIDDVVDKAIKIADTALEKLYPLPKEGETK